MASASKSKEHVPCTQIQLTLQLTDREWGVFKLINLAITMSFKSAK